MTDPVDELFVGALEDFVARRDALVRQLKKDGDKDMAAEVKALRKPSAAAWAVNQVARQQPDAVAVLIDAARAVHAAQANAVQGKDAGDLRTTSAAWRGQIQALAGKVPPQHRDDAAGTFEAASASDEWQPVLRAGRFVVALSPGGFGLQDMPDPVLVRRHDPVPLEPDVVEQPTRDEAAIAAARAELEKVTHRLRRAEQRLEQARQAVDDASRARDDAARAVQELEGS